MFRELRADFVRQLMTLRDGGDLDRALRRAAGAAPTAGPALGPGLDELFRRALYDLLPTTT